MTPKRFVLTLTLLATAFGCRKDRTEIVLGMATDLTASTPLSSVRLQVFSLPEDVLLADQELPISGTVNELYELPGTYAVYSASGSADRFRALLTATDNNGKTLVVRSAVLSLVPEKTLFARLGVVSACEGMTDCGTGQTCIEGHCASEDIDSSRLPEYTSGMENEVDCASATTFVDTSTKKPLEATGTSCPVGGTCLEGVCLSPPPGDGGADRATDGPARPTTPTCLVNSDCSSEVLSGVSAVSAGQSYACALLTGGTVRCWGDDSYGQLGNGSTSTNPVPTPVAVTGLAGVMAVSAAYHHTCALLTGGTVQCWGDDSYGQLGSGSTTNTPVPTPVAVSGLTGVTAISVGFTHTCALLTGGTVQCWGDNTFGQLGNGSTTNSPLPTPVTGLAGVTAISVGFYFSCALLTGGAVECWGDDEAGAIGNGSTTTSVPAPVAVTGLSGATRAEAATAISAGATHACALLMGGTVQCWGNNTYGQLGNGSTTNSSLPAPVTGLSGATAVSADDNHTCALTGGTVQCWGDNKYGELGNGSTSSTPVTAPVGVTGLSGVAAVSASQNATCVLLIDGALQCWGDNRYGELGNGSASTTPVTKPAPGGGTPGLICALGYCVDPCSTSSDCPNGQRCIEVTNASADAGIDGGVRETACQAPETVTCQSSTECKTPLICGSDQQCRDACATSADCPVSQVCTSTSHVCADPAVDKDYNPATNELVAGGTGGSGGRGGQGGVGGRGGAGGAGGVGGAGRGGAGGAAGGGATGSGNTSGSSGASGFLLLPNASGAVDSSGAGVMGGWYALADGDNRTGNPSLCATRGAPACSAFATSSPAQGSGQEFGPSDITVGKMCASGTVAKAVPDTASGAAVDYTGIWGAYVAMSFNTVPLADGGVTQSPYDATAHGITGISFDIDTVPTSSMRVEFTTSAVPGTTDTEEAYWGGATLNASPVVAGANTFTWAGVSGPMYETGYPPFDPTKILSIQFHVISNPISPVNFNFCISNLTALTR